MLYLHSNILPSFLKIFHLNRVILEVINKNIDHTNTKRRLIMNEDEKKENIDGVINSKNLRFPAPMKSYNTPTSEYEYTDKEKIKEKSHTRY